LSQRPTKNENLYISVKERGGITSRNNIKMVGQWYRMANIVCGKGVQVSHPPNYGGTKTGKMWVKAFVSKALSAVQHLKTDKALCE
jgi:hypothetical protein